MIATFFSAIAKRFSTAKQQVVAPAPINKKTKPKVLTAPTVAACTVNKADLNKPSAATAKKPFVPFLAIIAPLLRLLKAKKQHFTPPQVQAFIAFAEQLSEQQFRALSEQALVKMGYQVTIVADNSSDLVVSINGQQALVRTFANAKSLSNFMIRPLGMAQFSDLANCAKAQNMAGAIYITAGKINQCAFDFGRQNSMFALGGLDLLRACQQHQLVDVSRVNDGQVKPTSQPSTQPLSAQSPQAA